MDNSFSLMVVLPEVVLALLGFLLLIVGLLKRDEIAKVTSLLTIFAFIITAAFVVSPQRLGFNFNGNLPIFAFHNMFVDDGLARFAKLLMLTGASLSLMLSWSYLKRENIDHPEYPVLVLFATLGMMLMVSASDLLSLYVGLELQSLALYVLAAFRRDDAKSSEAGLKYFVLGALSSGLILYGISLIYGYAGTTNFVDLAFALRDAPANHLGLIFGVVFICAALAFKVSAVPFHMWTPDVYEGAPTPVTAFFASSSGIAGLVLLARLLHQPLMALSHDWAQIIMFISIASMLLGSFAGLAQSNIKRLMAYSSIANVGYLLAGIAIMSRGGLQAMLIYLSIYFINTLGAFGVVLCLRRQGKAVERLTDLAGLAKTNPLLALAMAIFMFSLAGVPPLAGFFGKYTVFLAAVQAGQIALAIVAVLTSVVAAYYYLRVVKLMYFDEAALPIDPLPDYGVKLTVGFAAVYMIVFTIWPAPIVDSALRAVISFMPAG